MVTSSQELASGVYTGWVRHRRYSPRAHDFRYNVFMMYLDLAELDTVLEKSVLWSKAPWAPARFRRKDYLGPEQLPLVDAVRACVFDKLGFRVDGPVRVLTNLRYFGFIINPLTVYYCFDEHERLQAMVLEVTNTPWGQRHQYALRCDPEAKTQRIDFAKAMHVSPFNPMDMTYRLAGSNDETSLLVHLENWQANEGERARIFDATLHLNRQPVTAGSLNKMLLAYPFMTLKVFWGIYWQALKLFIKRVPVFKYGQLSETNT